jgi:hypothetical protein
LNTSERLRKKPEEKSFPFSRNMLMNTDMFTVFLRINDSLQDNRQNCLENQVFLILA